MKQQRFVLNLSVLLFLIGCSTLPVPTTGSSILVIGNVELDAKGYQNYGSATVNGHHVMRIEVTIMNTESGKIEKLISDGDGFFFSSNLPPGQYVLKKMYYKNSSGSSWADLFISITNGDRKFSIESGKVNNLGQITWTSDTDTGAFFHLNKNYDISETFLERRDKDENWKPFEIVNTRFHN